MTSSASTPPPIGVGILGAGPVTQAIHLPALARLGAEFRVARLMDVDHAVAESVAARVGAAWTTAMDDLLGDPDVDVVAICSPHQFHAAQVIAACRSGKKAVLCEKPFAMTPEEAESIAAVSRDTGVPIVVGAMHAYDAGWVIGDAEFAAVPHTVRSSIVLPPNARFEDFATEVITRPDPDRPDRSDPEVLARMISRAVMGLAIHDLPLIRRLVSRGAADAWTRVEVLSADVLAPFGYLIELRIGDVDVELHALMSDNWAPEWSLTATADEAELDIAFTPSYVQAGSAAAAVTTIEHGRARTTAFEPVDANGYEGEWREMAALARGAAPRIPLDALIDDLRFALDIAARASSVVQGGAAVAA